MATSEDKPFDQAVCVHGHRAGDARRAFRAAAEEAGVLIGNDRRPAPKTMNWKR